MHILSFGEYLNAIVISLDVEELKFYQNFYKQVENIIIACLKLSYLLSSKIMFQCYYVFEYNCSLGRHCREHHENQDLREV